MVLSEDAIAIVASNLTIAHVTAAKGLGAAGFTESVDDGVKTIGNLYLYYRQSLKDGTINHDATGLRPA